MNLDPYDFDLPDTCIATRPTEPRDACKLLVQQGGDAPSDYVFRDIVDLLQPGDLLIANDTRVIPALLFGELPARDEQGQTVHVQLNLLEDKGEGEWLCLCKPGRRVKPGDTVEFGAGLSASLVEKYENGEMRFKFRPLGEAFWAALNELGRMPIPPYIQKLRASDRKDDEDYQTVFADKAGSVAAPTAGLHFTDGLMAKLKEKNIGLEYVTLHVGAGTFAGLSDDAFETGKLHSEWCEISESVKRKIDEARSLGGRVIAVGTTSLRTLESRADKQRSVISGAGDTDIFIQPGYQFQVVDGLITNFHLPRSSLFMLVSALMGTDVMQVAYNHAINSGYKFYSYGDACLLLPAHD